MDRNGGFTFIEVLFVLVVIGILAAMAVPITDQMIRRSKADSAVIVAQNAVDTARDRAVAERRNFVLTFVGSNRIRLDRQEIDANGVVIGTTTTNTFTLEGRQQFLKFPALPDTPDAFGATAAQSFTGTAPVMFTSDGSLIDSNGDVTNGSLYFGVQGQTQTARAVTIFGVTGLTRTWKWSGNQWQQ
ncbi:MAG TPA: type II secretion system protein [Vicinamibacterales bacterium]|jgi:prepilin-type N-terminal cleavage/methylation domain-containing protein